MRRPLIDQELERETKAPVIASSSSFEKLDAVKKMPFLGKKMYTNVRSSSAPADPSFRADVHGSAAVIARILTRYAELLLSHVDACAAPSHSKLNFPFFNRGVWPRTALPLLVVVVFRASL